MKAGGYNMMTTQEKLEQIEKAISAIENGAQEYRIGGNKSVRRADLSTLYNERRMLQRQLNEENGGGVYVASFDRR